MERRVWFARDREIETWLDRVNGVWSAEICLPNSAHNVRAYGDTEAEAIEAVERLFVAIERAAEIDDATHAYNAAGADADLSWRDSLREEAE